MKSLPSLPLTHAGPDGRYATKRRGYPWQLATFCCLSLLPIIYSTWALYVVATAGDIGLTCVLGTIIREDVPRDYPWEGDIRPAKGDQLVAIDGHPIGHYPDYVASLRNLRDRSGEMIPVAWRPSGATAVVQSWATIRTRPSRAYFWSLLWFAQEMAIFFLGAYVYWKRPADESARLFFWLCIVTVGAYMGGYHWTEIVVEPALIYRFAAFAALVPVVSLHFYLVFPRPTRSSSGTGGRPGGPLRHPGALPRRDLVVHVPVGPAPGRPGAGGRPRPRVGHRLDQGAVARLYRALGGRLRAVHPLPVRQLSRGGEPGRAEPGVLDPAGVVAGVFPIGYLLWGVWWEPARLGLDSAAWPMYVVSLLYTVAYALSITRYKLMQVEAIYNRGKMYVLLSLAAGLLYSAIRWSVTTLLIGEQFMDDHTSRGVVVGALVIGS